MPVCTLERVVVQEPEAKKLKTATFDDKCEEVKKELLAEKSRDTMLEEIFDAWDKDGNGKVSFEEILPHYMKSRNHVEQTEQEVRSAFSFFCRSRNCNPSDGISLTVFKSWMHAKSDDAVASRYLTAVLGMTKEPYHMNINHAVVKEFEGKPLKEIVNLPPHAIEGLAEHSDEVMQLLGIKTVKDLGSWKFYRLSRAIVSLAAKEQVGHMTEVHKCNIRNALNTEYETTALKDILSLHVSAFAGFPPKCDPLLKKLRISTVEQLGKRKFFAWAEALTELSEFEQ